MPESLRTSRYVIYVEAVASPALLLTFLLLLGVLVVAHPVTFHALYESEMRSSPALMEDGLTVAYALSGEEPYSEINKELKYVRLEPREIYHYEDVRGKLKLARLITAASLLGLLVMVFVFSARWHKVAYWSLAWFVTLAAGAGVWSFLNFRNFFRSMHWLIFLDDTWILPQHCYSLLLYPYGLWKLVGTVIFGMVLLILMALVFLAAFPPKLPRLK